MNINQEYSDPFSNFDLDLFPYIGSFVDVKTVVMSTFVSKIFALGFSRLSASDKEVVLAKKQDYQRQKKNDFSGFAVSRICFSYLNDNDLGKIQRCFSLLTTDQKETIKRQIEKKRKTLDREENQEPPQAKRRLQF